MINAEKSAIVAPESSSGKCYLPARFVLTFLFSCAMALEYAHRFCLSVAIVVMVNHTAIDSPNETTDEDGSCPTSQALNETDNGSEGTYEWSPSIQGVILGAYFYGYICTQIAGGRLSELAGGKWPLGISILTGSVLTLITPIAADIGVGALVVVRATMGLLHGICLPTAFAIFAHWAPVEERSTLLSLCFIGNHVGTVISMSLAGYLCEQDFLGGWPSVFYIFGFLGCIWFVFWACLAHSKPSDHRRISRQEIDYIQKGHIQMLEDQKLPVPWSEILRSTAIWSIVVSSFTGNWGATTLLTKLPTYMEVVLHVPIQQNGLVNSLIYFCCCITLFFSGYLSDYLRTQKGFSNTKVRKGFQLIAALGPAITTALIPSIGCQNTYAVVCLTLAMSFHGMSAGGVMSVTADMAPHHSATIFGFINAIGCIAAVLCPLVAGIILDKAHASLEQWSYVFYLSAALYLIGGIVFLIWGSGERQSWAYTTQKNQLFTVPKAEKEPIKFTARQDDLEANSKYGTISNNPKQRRD